MERSRTSLYLYMNLSVNLSTTREIIVITGEKGKCYQTLSNKERGDGKKAWTAERQGIKPAIWLCWRLQEESRLAQIIKSGAPFFHQHGVYVLRVFSFISSAIYSGAE